MQGSAFQPIGDRLRDGWRRFGCTPAESVALSILLFGALGVLALVWWHQRPATVDGAASMPEGLVASASPLGPSEPDNPAIPAPVAAGQSEPTAPTRIRVHVAGHVREPGVYELDVGARVVDAVAAAGGPAPDADVEGVNLAQPLADGMQVRVPRPGETPTAPIAPAVTTDATVATGSAAEAPAALVNLNTADQATLETLPGIGPVTAQQIIDHRTEVGGFQMVEELLDVRGIGEATLADLSDLVTVG